MGRGGGGTESSFRVMMKFIHLTIFALPFDSEQLFAISDSMFPTRLILILISRAIGVDIFRAI